MPHLLQRQFRSRQCCRSRLPLRRQSRTRSGPLSTARPEAMIPHWTLRQVDLRYNFDLNLVISIANRTLDPLPVTIDPKILQIEGPRFFDRFPSGNPAASTQFGDTVIEVPAERTGCRLAASLFRAVRCLRRVLRTAAMDCLLCSDSIHLLNLPALRQAACGRLRRGGGTRSQSIRRFRTPDSRAMPPREVP